MNFSVSVPETNLTTKKTPLLCTCLSLPLSWHLQVSASMACSRGAHRLSVLARRHALTPAEIARPPQPSSADAARDANQAPRRGTQDNVQCKEKWHVLGVGIFHMNHAGNYQFFVTVFVGEDKSQVHDGVASGSCYIAFMQTVFESTAKRRLAAPRSDPNVVQLLACSTRSTTFVCTAGHPPLGDKIVGIRFESCPH